MGNKMNFARRTADNSQAAYVAKVMRAKGVDQMAADYMKAVNEAMMRKSSLRYTEVFKSLHGDLEALRAAMDNGVSAESFTARTIADFGLIQNGQNDRDVVIGFNKAQVAICEFAMDSNDWRLARDGCVYREEEDGLARLRPVKRRDSNEFGFGTVFYEGASLGEDGRPVNIGARVAISGHLDIKEAVSEYERRRAPATSLGMR